MNVYGIASCALALVLYIPLCFEIRSGKVKQNLASWILWFVLDGIVLVTVLVQGGNFLMLAAFTFGSFVTSCFIYKSGNFSWTKFETFVTVLVFVCLLVWMQSGPKMATIVSTITVVIAGAAQLRDSYKKPWENPFLIYLGYTAANVLAVMGGKEWSVEERFYPGVIALFSLAIVICTAQKFWQKRPEPVPT